MIRRIRIALLALAAFGFAACSNPTAPQPNQQGVSQGSDS